MKKVTLMDCVTVDFGFDLDLARLIAKMDRKRCRQLSAAYRTELGKAIREAAALFVAKMDALPKAPPAPEAEVKHE